MAIRWSALRRLIRAVVDLDPVAMEAATRQLGESKPLLAPLAWAAGTLVLVLTGVKLLILNWRLSLVQLVPAAWVWLATWNLKQHVFHGASFRHPPVIVVVGVMALIVAVTVAAIWCNAVFAFAIDGPPPPRISTAVARAGDHARAIVGWGVLTGGGLALVSVIVPRIAGRWVFSVLMSVMLGVMLILFVAVPARILGVRRKRLPLTESIGRAATGGALSAVAMGPAFVLDRVGLLLLGRPGLQVLGFLLLSAGAALYAAAMSSVRAVKLSMRLAGG